MGEDHGNPYAVPGAGDSSAPPLGHDATCDRLSKFSLMVGTVGVVVFGGYWNASPDTTDLWFHATLSLMATALVLGLASLVLGRRRHARRGRAWAAVLVAVSPALFVLVFYALFFGESWLWVKVLTSLGVGY